MTPLLLTIREAAPLLGFSERRLYTLVAQGALPEGIVVRFGRAVKLSRPRLLAWLGAVETAALGSAIEATKRIEVDGSGSPLATVSKTAVG